MYALTCGISPSSVVEVFSTVMNNSGFKSINSISADLMQTYRLSENPKISMSVQHYMKLLLISIYFINYSMLE